MNKWKVGALVVVGMMILYCLINLYAIYSLLANYSISPEALSVYEMEMLVYGMGLLLGVGMLFISMRIRNEETIEMGLYQSPIPCTDSDEGEYF